jgi:hypothetical protein
VSGDAHSAPVGQLPGDRRSLADNQTRPEAVALLGASLQCDHRAETAQSVYFGVAAAGSVAASAVSGRLADEPLVVASLPGVVVAAMVALVVGRHRRWLEDGRILRERYERFVFDFPPWTARPSDPGRREPAVDRLAADHLARDGRRRDSLAQWFAVDRAVPFDRQVLTAQYESIVTGSLTRQLWGVFLGFVVFLVVVAATILSWVTWPPDAAQFSGWITALLPLSAVAITAVRAYRFGRDRQDLADEVGEALRTPVPDLRVMTLLVEERLAALRRRRVLVPDWFFRVVYPAIRKVTGFQTPATPGLTR